VYIASLSCFSTMICWAMEGIKNADYYSFLSQRFQDGTALLFRMEPKAGFSRPSTTLPQKRPLDAKLVALTGFEPVLPP
jgi:hypothetical protein